VIENGVVIDKGSVIEQEDQCSIHQCPGLLISAPASGKGKTTVTAALAAFYRSRGKQVRVFKTGPDFLDPTILEQASGAPVYQLDLWMGGESHCRQLLHDAAGQADLILIEGVMGLFDGTSSSADLAQLFNIPVLAVIDATAMAQTFGAIAYGLAHYRPGLPFAGVIANRVASVNHGSMLAESLPPSVSYLGALPRDPNMELPSRHLGLLHAMEIDDLHTRIETAAQALAQTGYDYEPKAVNFAAAAKTELPKELNGYRIAVAKDRAFSFVYRANLNLLESMGAKLLYFSPLEDQSLPQADALYLPGGYPELHLQSLAANTSMHESIQHHHAHGKPIVAECGGMLYLLQSLTDQEGQSAPMVGLLPGHAVMQNKLSNLGMHSVELPEGLLHGHTFHHSSVQTPLQPITQSKSSRQHGRGEAVYRDKRLHASYMHLYFPSNPQASARLFVS